MDREWKLVRIGIFVWVMAVGLPWLLSWGVAGAEMVWSDQLPAAERPVPVLDAIALAGPLLALLSQLVVTGGLAFWAHRVLRGDGPRLVLLLFYGMALGISAQAQGLAMVAVGSQVWWRLPVERLPEPGGAKLAFLYPMRTGCGWSVYQAQRLEPSAVLHADVSCNCDLPVPPAHLAWSAGQPGLVDDLGMPYSCPPPGMSCGCQQGGLSPVGLGAAALAVGLARQRRPRAEGPRSRPSNALKI
jgi:hypothetical protein